MGRFGSVRAVFTRAAPGPDLARGAGRDASDRSGPSGADATPTARRAEGRLSDGGERLSQTA